VDTCILLLNAGHEASVNGLTAGVLNLVRTGQWDTVAQAARHGADDAWFRTVVEELLRHDTPLPLFERWVLQDTDVAGHALQRGQKVALLYASGNRDPRRFSAPDELRLTRSEDEYRQSRPGRQEAVYEALIRAGRAWQAGDRVTVYQRAGAGLCVLDDPDGRDYDARHYGQVLLNGFATRLRKGLTADGYAQVTRQRQPGLFDTPLTDLRTVWQPVSARTDGRARSGSSQAE